MDNLVVLVSALMLVAVACQWLAWRLHLPALVLLSAAGLMLGPVTGVFNPAETMGSFLPQLVSLAVAVILFDGGLNLNLQELRHTRRAVHQMVLVGAPVAWLMIAAAAHYLAGLSWPVAVVFGGIMIVTGPTVILPMLRQARLNARVGSVLKWEGIVNDPIGALFAVIAYEYITSTHLQAQPVVGAAEFVVSLVLLTGGSFLAGRLVAVMFRRGVFPEFLKPPLLLTAIIAAYALGNAVQDEGGLIAVTVMGVTLANARLPSIDELRRFKEYITLLLVSLLFIVLTATLTPADLAALDWRAVAFIAVLMFVIRPLTAGVSLIGTQLEWKERAFVGWVAPRGVVAVAVAGLFGPLLVEAGHPDGAMLVPLAFAIVFATVVAHGFTISPLGRLLGLVAKNRHGILIVGANPFTQQLAESLHTREVPVMLMDSNWHRLRSARLAEIPVHYGEPLAEATEHQLELNRFSYLIAATDNFAYNSLVCSRFGHEMGRDRIYQLPGDQDDEADPKAYAHHLRGRTLVGEGARWDDLMARLRQGWEMHSVKLTEEFTFDDYRAEHPDLMPLLAVGENDAVFFFRPDTDWTPKPGDTVFGFGPAKEKNGESKENS